jgi:conjugal transfer mating pair stabilization protein TraN
MIGFANCCSEKGWGIDFNLTECTQEEKDLEEAKKNKLAVEVGRYCDKDVLGICISDRKAYCVFPDMLGRIVQEQGRKVQLRISFGNGEHPNCRGITPDELQRIHFDAIDFSDFYTTLASKEQIEDPEWIKKRIKDNINPGVRGGNK